MGNLKDGLDLVKSATDTAKDTPQGKEAIENIGNSVVTITKAIDNALLPLAAVNFGFDKARKYFSGKFQSEISDKIDNIPPENLVEPKPSVAGPALQGLAFTHDENELREMYLNLISTAMDSRVAHKAHPAFVEIIKQINTREARLLDTILKGNVSLPIAEIHLKSTTSSSHSLLKKHILDIINVSSNEPVVEEDIPAVVDNLIRLGLIEVNYSQWLSQEGRYDWVENRPELIELRAKYASSEDSKVEPVKGILNITEFGKQFGKVIIK